MADDVKVIVKAILDNKEFQQALKKGETQSTKSVGKIRKTFDAAKAAFVGVGAVLAGTVVAGITKLVKVSSDAQEAISKFNTVFRDVKKEAEVSAKSLATNFGLSSVAAKQLLSDTGDLLSGFGFTGSAALELSTKVNELAVDLASFTNYSGGAKGASEALTKALLGEREQVKQLGIAILETDVQARVALNTQKGMTFETERQAKAYATLQLAQEQSKNAIGDFARTSDQFANQIRILQGRFQDLAVSLGNNILPYLTPFVKIMNKATDQSLKLEKVTTELSKSTKIYSSAVKQLASETGDLTEAQRTLLEQQKELGEAGIKKNLVDLALLYEKKLKIGINFASNEAKKFQDVINFNRKIVIEHSQKISELSVKKATLTQKFKEGTIEYKDYVKQTKEATKEINKQQGLIDKHNKTIERNNKSVKSWTSLQDRSNDSIDAGINQAIELIEINEKYLSFIEKASPALAKLIETRMKENEASEAAAEAEKKRIDKLKKAREEYNNFLKSLQDELKAFRKENNNTELLDQAKQLEALLANLEIYSDKVVSSAEDRAAITKRIEELRSEHISNEIGKRIAEHEKYKKYVGDLLKSLGTLYGHFHDRQIRGVEDEAAMEMSIIDDKVASGVMTEEDGANEKERINRELAYETAVIERKKAKFDKAAALFQVVARTSEAVMKAWAMSPYTLGQPWAGLAIAAGFSEGAAIGMQPLPELPARANGGPTIPGMPYTVGERGRETFVPDGPGHIIPNNVTDGLLFGVGNGSTVQNTSNSTTNNTTNNYNIEGARDISDMRNELLRLEGQGAFS
jgi:hypothetical protein